VNACGAAILFGAAVGIVACAETRRSLGEACLKNEDCLSGICSDQQCASAPPLLDAEAPAIDAAPEAAAVDAAPEAAVDAAAPPEAGEPPEAGDAGAGEGGG
jgi:hypothetical protein